MKIFSAAQMNAWDQYSIAHEPIASIDLMERAAIACTQWICNHYQQKYTVLVFAGPGNNGGDGLAFARLLMKEHWPVEVFRLFSTKYSTDHSLNYDRLVNTGALVHTIHNAADIPNASADCIIIDALFGTGLTRPLTGMQASIVAAINYMNGIRISIDIASGLIADQNTNSDAIIQATHTLTFQAPKTAMLLPGNKQVSGNIHVLPIGLDVDFSKQTDTAFYYTDEQLARSLYKPRTDAGHKYSFGHALVFAGSEQMMGAALLCAKACLRSGAGLVTLHASPSLAGIVQTAVPEVIASTVEQPEVLLAKKAAIGIGPGMQQTTANNTLLQSLMENCEVPMVIDATALQLLHSLLENTNFKFQVPTILTPHTGEFDKLFGNVANDWERLERAREKAAIHDCYIVLKGPHTMIACPDGRVYFNSTGNSGMATAGSGDVLTGIITGLLAQGYAAKDACLLGVFLHGSAGDLAANQHSKESMIASDITEQLGAAYRLLQATNATARKF